MNHSDILSKIKGVEFNFNDPNAKVVQHMDSANVLQKIEIYYGGKDGGDSEGHGHWVAENIDGLFQVTLDRKPDNIDNGRHAIESIHPQNAYNDQARLDRISAKEAIIDELQLLDPLKRSLKEDVETLRNKFYECGSCGHDENIRLKSRFNSVANALFAERYKILESYKAQKEDLIQEAEGLSYSSDFKAAKEQMKNLQDRWKQAPRASREDEDMLWKRFKEASDRLYARAKADYEERKRKAQSVKEDLIREAESLSYSSDFKAAKEQMKNLQDRWKQAPRASKEDEDLLWARFRQAADRLYAKAKADYEERKRKQEEARSIKESLIREAENLSYSSDFKAAKEQMKNLQDRWKQAPRSSKEDEDMLWARFRQAADRLYAKAKIDYENRQFQQREAKAKKERIISQIENLVNTSDFKNASFEIKRLSDEFYNAGSAGKDNQSLKNQLNDAKNRFYAAKKIAAEQKHREYMASLQERLQRKRDALSRLENALYNKYDQLNNLLSRPEPSYNNPHRWEIADRRNAKESAIRASILDIEMKKSSLINEIAELQSKINSSW